MPKIDLRTILLLLVVLAAFWTQWKISTQEDNIFQLTEDLELSKLRVSNLTLEVNDIRQQVRLDKEAVDDWYIATTQLKYDQKNYQSEVRDALAKFKYQLVVDAKDTEPAPRTYRIGDDIVIPAINGMWNAYDTTIKINYNSGKPTGGAN